VRIERQNSDDAERGDTDRREKTLDHLHQSLRIHVGAGAIDGVVDRLSARSAKRGGAYHPDLRVSKYANTRAVMK